MNYGATLETRLRRADTVIVFDFARIRCVTRAFRSSDHPSDAA
ncbi:MAG TPA: hypothetical protein VM282_23875 [Acidimicrobiales bacterium]|nr:hypothetical protein [Acidimicrobiales bacterium]